MKTCKEHGGRSDREVDLGVVEVLVYLIHDAGSPRDQPGRVYGHMFERVRRAIECRVEVNARHVSY
eukprot:216023-Pleurochrysis_carterae.AAC.1